MLRVNNVSKTINKKHILRNVSLDITKGEVIGLLGPNGSGKTTLLKIIAGLIIPDIGYVEKKGAAIKLGCVFDKHNFLNHLSGLENIKTFLCSLDHSYNANVESLFNELGLCKVKNIKYKEYSSGMKRRLDLIGVFLLERDLYILDEPTNTLDIEAIAKFFEIINRLSNKHKSFLISSHHVHELEHSCTSFIFINEGNISKKLSREIMLERYGTLTTAYNEIAGKEKGVSSLHYVKTK